MEFEGEVVEDEPRSRSEIELRGPGFDLHSICELESRSGGLTRVTHFVRSRGKGSGGCC